MMQARASTPGTIRHGRDHASHAVPRWATVAAVAIPLCVLPSAVWRALHGLDVLATGPELCGVQSRGEAAYVVTLSVVSLGAALLSFALVRPWGERTPQWLPSQATDKFDPGWSSE